METAGTGDHIEMGVSSRASTFSVIIPTYGRGDLLWDAVAGLMPQLAPADELLVVDQNEVPLEPPPPLRQAPLVIHRLSPPSLTRARNLGIRLSRNPWIVFLDDDIVPGDGLRAGWAEGVRRYPGWALACALDQTDAPPVTGVGYVDLHTGAIRTNYTSRREFPCDVLPGGHFVVPRRCLPPAPWFWPRFRGSSQGEEIDFAIRLRRCGTPVVFFPTARIRHLKAPSGGCRSPGFQRRFFLDQCFNEGLFYGRHGVVGTTHRFAARIKGFVEFHSRSTSGRNWPMVAKGFAHAAQGLAWGWWERLRDYFRERAGAGPKARGGAPLGRKGPVL